MRALKLAAFTAVPLALALSGAPLGGCGAPPKTPAVDAGFDAGVGDLEAYFAIQKGRCFEYTTSDSKQAVADLGMAVEKLDTTQFPVQTHVMVYRQGFVRLTDYLAIDGANLVLYKRDFFGGKSVKFTPPVTVLRAPIKGGDKLETVTTAQVRDETGKILDEKEITVRVDVLDPVDLNTPVKNPIKASKVITTDPSLSRSETRAFVPGAGGALTDPEGSVTIEFNFEKDDSKSKVLYKLQNVRSLGTDEQARATPCGTAP